MQQKLLFLSMLFMLFFTIISCSSDDIQVTHHGKNKALILGKWELESKNYYDGYGHHIYSATEEDINYPPQILVFHRQEIMIQTDFYKEEGELEVVCSEQSLFQWCMREDKLYLGIGREVDSNDYQEYDILVLTDDKLVLEREVNEYDNDLFQSRAKYVWITYNRVSSH
ncbi:hypothetical protein HX049_15665 [Myroides odoratimimus]|uniref:hypothetical protein n=1 Tax=Myroides odoratimimus TaxID=76832 RepID=UPI0025757FEF|nr:hypothetical protein [Myroides odoratimimus]MDM1398586.1 hypothetical protein [Myroides odoratimimus]